MPLLPSERNQDAISAVVKIESRCASGAPAIGESGRFSSPPIAHALHTREHGGELTDLRITIQWIGHALSLQFEQDLDLAACRDEH